CYTFAAHVVDDRGESDLFFFQAEDGIRDLTVTGVQTCALPISSRPLDAAELLLALTVKRALVRQTGQRVLGRLAFEALDEARVRSEERRVGKECRHRWGPYG